MKTRLLFLLCLSPVAALAQSEVFWNFPQRFPRTQQQAETYIFQLSAIGVLPPLSGNLTAAVQQGGSNQVWTQTFGVGNQVGALQLGNANQLEVILSGNGNTYTFVQEGNRNLLSMPTVRTDNTQLTVIQLGDGNRLFQDGFIKSRGVPLIIEQRGGMELRISNN